MFAAILAIPCLAAFLDDEPDNRQRGYCIYPLRAEQEVGNQAYHHN